MTAIANLRHAAADLAPVHKAPPAHGRIVAGEHWLERAQTELLNRASYEADGRLQREQPVVLDAPTANVIAARAAARHGQLVKARRASHDARQEIRTPLLRG